MACVHSHRKTTLWCGRHLATYRKSKRPACCRTKKRKGPGPFAAGGTWSMDDVLDLAAIWGLAIHHRPPGLNIPSEESHTSRLHGTQPRQIQKGRSFVKTPGRESRCWMLEIRQVLRFFLSNLLPWVAGSTCEPRDLGMHANYKVTSGPSTLPVARMRIHEGDGAKECALFSSCSPLGRRSFLQHPPNSWCFDSNWPV
jgi:hypothetical protein